MQVRYCISKYTDFSKALILSVKRRLVIYLLCFVIVVCNSHCKKMIEVTPPVTSITSENVYTSNATAAAVLTGIYTNISKANFSASGTVISIPFFTGLSSDELSLYSASSNNIQVASYRNSLISTATPDFWFPFYQTLFVANSAIAGLTNTNKLTESVKQQLLGEAKFIRAFCYFYLVNLYGDVPLVTGTDYLVNSSLSQAPKDHIWQQIISDLKDAVTHLNSNYLQSDVLTTYSLGEEERVRPTKWAAAALLARAYLYIGDWVNAEAQSSLVINNTALFELSNLSNVFMKSSLGNKEAIWQLQPVNVGWNTEDAKLFILTGVPNNNRPVYLSPNILNAFEVGDLRRKNWIKDTTFGSVTYSYPFKYKSAKLNNVVTEYEVVLRLSEQFLIRAEARAQVNNIDGAKSDLNIIRLRAGLPMTLADNKASLLDSILHERQVELFTEWGHRWFDLKRTNTIDVVMNSVTLNKGGTWVSSKALYPIPQSEIDKDPLLKQNLGY
jgi:starch-binding outer membrane protein, SusD/RagB family